MTNLVSNHCWNLFFLFVCYLLIVKQPRHLLHNQPKSTSYQSIISIIYKLIKNNIIKLSV